MRKTKILLLTLALALCTAAAQAAQRPAALDRGRDLFDCGRWSDARHEFLRARQALTPEELLLRQEVDFYLAACAVELGAAEREASLCCRAEKPCRARP